MIFDPPLQNGVLVKRYKRFLADVELPGGRMLTMHCPNTGAMTGCSEPGSQVWFSKSDNPRRKYPNTLEIVEDSAGHKIGVNSALANRLVEEHLQGGQVKALSQYGDIRREVGIPGESGRFDFKLMSPDASVRDCFLEVKSLMLCSGDGLGIFPDTVSVRATRHVKALEQCVQKGDRAVLFFCVQHNGISRTAIAAKIDPDYSRAVSTAIDTGVEVMAYSAKIETSGITLARQLEFNCG